ncbi:hypothetical protein EHV15_26340 [Paenibacillus oralis]|uniref:HTH araC/xylS-type domain-containing protein n=2 Tax=Paenibacillus oralis TaxID=2490856 RepID=A0A3P3U724_9BACL|nr:hypothetical protein EHV15_26340 [Paenibacillus oralis]
MLLSDFKHLQAAAAGEALNPGHILEIQTVPELLAWAKEKCCEFVNLFVRWLDEQRDNVVIKAKQNLEGNYQQTCSLLKGTRLRMTEISEQVGFDNSSYFTVVFNNT